MSDLLQISNTRDFVQQLKTGTFERVEVGPCDLGQHGGAEFGPATWSHVRMTGTKLVGLNVKQLRADRWMARGALLNGTRFEAAELSGVHISNSQAMAIQWPSAVLRRCSFVETPLTNANLSRALFTDCRFEIADLNHANLSEALLLNCSLSDNRQGGAVVDNANLSGAVLCGVNLSGAGLFRANFDGAVLVNVDMRGANLVDASFRDTVMVQCKTDHADMSPQTESQIKQARSDVGAIIAALQRHHEPQQLAAVTAGLLAGGVIAGASAAPAPTPSADPVAELVQLDFATLVRELQGRGGPSELGRLRVDGNHVYARGVDGQEVRLTAQDRSAPIRPPVMRQPEPERAAPPAPAAPAPPPNFGGGGGDGGGLEID